MKQYSCNRYIPLIFILIAALVFSPIFSRLTSNIVIEGAENAEASDTETIYKNLEDINITNNSLTDIIKERNNIFPKYLDRETTNARLDYTTLDVNSINMQLVLLTGGAIVIGIFIIIHLMQ